MKVLPVLAYVAGPYRDPRGAYYIRENIRAAEAIALSLWQQGVPTICPHKNTQFFDGAADDEVWLEGDLEIISRCDALVLVPGWETSAGTRAEVLFAEARKTPVLEAGYPELARWIAGLRGEA